MLWKDIITKSKPSIIHEISEDYHYIQDNIFDFEYGKEYIVIEESMRKYTFYDDVTQENRTQQIPILICRQFLHDERVVVPLFAVDIMQSAPLNNHSHEAEDYIYQFTNGVEIEYEKEIYEVIETYQDYIGDDDYYCIIRNNEGYKTIPFDSMRNAKKAKKIY